MSLKLEKAMDSTAIANGIMRDLIDVERMESMLECELSSEDLFKIDCAILSSLLNTQDFSRDLLQQLESGKLETVAVKPPKFTDFELQNIQQEVMMDITLPLQNMFDEMANYVIDAI